eukprot:TRINITY_DN4226_c0_g2_i1.p1 TRINITY_DN4226_c0_g2~~TRINITY_DN4226_c0_g2_i1.p1  ORF type:complete len:451 (+),score=51.76 TRINITY_DN4226_c0_g2_i1:130-1482(+)
MRNMQHMFVTRLLQIALFLNQYVAGDDTSLFTQSNLFGSEVFHSKPSDDKLIGALKQSSATQLQKQEECDPFNQKAQCGPKVCRDISPPGDSCENYLKLGLCKMDSFMTEGYCRKSCGKCCEDVVVPGVYNCFEVHNKQMCELDIVKKAGYCASTCGLCDETGKAVKPPVNVSPVLDCLAHGSIECDSKALLQLKDMTSTWAQWQLGSWKADTHPCEGWKGITCITIKNVHKRVSSIQLGKYSWRIDENGGRQLVNNWENYVDKMDCPLPTYLSNMAFLEIISLQRVGMRGPIPHVFDLPNLKIVDLHFNFFDGPIPTQISQLKQLQVLDLSLNWITGSIPVGFSVLTNLERLDLWNNKLSGTLNPQFSTFEKLDWVNINNNKFVGSIPMQYSVWSSIQWFYADPQSGKQLCIPQQLEDLWHLDDAQTDIYQLHLCSQQQTLQSPQSQQQ